MAKEIIVTQIKSAIGKHKSQKATLVALGCRRMHQSVVKTETPQIKGMIEKVKHLVRVEEK